MECQDFEFEEGVVAETVGLPLHGANLVVGSFEGAGRDRVVVISENGAAGKRQRIGELSQHFDACRFRAANPRVFGSVLHGTDQDGSDLDLLVDALPGATLFDLGGLQMELEEMLGVAVDLLTPGDLPLRFRERVLAEAAPV